MMKVKKCEAKSREGTPCMGGHSGDGHMGRRKARPGDDPGAVMVAPRRVPFLRPLRVVMVAWEGSGSEKALVPSWPPSVAKVVCQECGHESISAKAHGEHIEASHNGGGGR